jgi:hypothetical protein
MTTATVTCDRDQESHRIAELHAALLQDAITVGVNDPIAAPV